MRVLLFANGIFNDGAMVRRHLAALDSPFVLCADGGALCARELGYTAKAIIGDFDSLSPAQVLDFEAKGAEIIQHPREKDESDLELALKHCLALGASAVTILGALGGRFDQTLANIFLLTLPELRDLPLVLVDGEQAIALLRPGRHRIEGGAGDTISLIPLTSSAEGIETRDLEYPLRGEALSLGPARGISNVMTADGAEVWFESGLLLLVHTIGRA